MIVVEGVVITVIIVMDLVKLVAGTRREIMNGKLVINATEMATEDVMFVMVQEMDFFNSHIPKRRNQSHLKNP